ncbi:EAL domain-containing protein [Amphritea sp. 1_MG-2023]|uniref:putative bifunctional diguanylate cyclase/phosphodiesterase n=1 Tax=Amphritea sp. 1_MG-2023 TaxID=3062670 RepID=UPI0026E16114|nr:EAL domain-containing protein [Amphritea sp. 1_MG-2023]MDO6562311.1 EAL domain-containing protein [Amphritea sp. 1_MG-2023]
MASLKLKKHHSQHVQLWNKLPFAIAELDSHKAIHHTNAAFRQISTLHGVASIQQKIEQLFNQLEQNTHQHHPTILQQIQAEDAALLCLEWQLHHANSRIFLTGRDVTQQQVGRNGLSVAEKIIECTPIGVMITGPDKRIQYTNTAFEQVTGYDSHEVLGHPPSILSSGKQSPDFYREMYQTIETEGTWQGEIWNNKRNGDAYLEWLSISALRDSWGEVTHYIGMFSEFTAQERVKEKLRTLAYYDDLTSLANRTLFNERLQHLVSINHKKKLCVVFIDIDGFKRINDTLSHQIGDLLLVAIADRIRATCREADTIARWGGDEFIIAIEVSDSHIGIDTFCKKHLKSLKQPFLINGRELSITASMGVSIYGDDAHNIAELIRNADIAMFQSKKRGKNRFEIFSPAHHEHLMENMEIENRLRVAIKENQIDVHFQPQVCKESIICGLEALARWHDPILGQVSPQKFIEVAEETGLINDLSQVIYHTALKKFKTIKVMSPALGLSVNLSASQLQDVNLVTSLKQVTDIRGIDPASIKLEITEDVLMSDIDQSIRNIALLKEMGFQVSLDDFGTGYSSLSYLKDLDIDEIKIDRSFVQSLTSSKRNKAIIEAIVAMSKVLDIDCVVEGVETAEQLNRLVQIGCTSFQGYYFYKPKPSNQIVELLTH